MAEIATPAPVVAHRLIDIAQLQNRRDHEFAAEVVAARRVVVDQRIEAIVLHGQEKLVDLKVEAGCRCKTILDACDVHANLFRAEFPNLPLGQLHPITSDS